MKMHEPPFRMLRRPEPMALDGRRVLVLGLGDSGLSAARWVARAGGTVRVADTREEPPRAAELAQAAPGAELRRGVFAPDLLDGVELICISPGLALSQPLVRDALARGLPIVGDIELFAWHVRRAQREAKVVAITGTNGKTTVTSLAGHLLRSAGVDCEVAGNIGPAALDALATRASAPEVWVLELSSYQLETTWSLAPDAAALLNLSEDHLDRYAGLEHYGAAKARVFIGARAQVVNREDPNVAACAGLMPDAVSFGLDAPPGVRDFGLIAAGGGDWLARGPEPILPAGELPIAGAHNAANVLAALALCEAVGVAPSRLAQGLRTFKGLPHRLQRVRTLRGVDWYDDSKGTNVGAAVAAMQGLGRTVVLIAGGEGKGQDFAPLALAAADHASRVLLIGRDAPALAAALREQGVAHEHCESLEAAVRRAAALAEPGQCVLLSPACASFDMFRDYRARGERFARAVAGLEA